MKVYQLQSDTCKNWLAQLLCCRERFSSLWRICIHINLDITRVRRSINFMAERVWKLYFLTVYSPYEPVSTYCSWYAYAICLKFDILCRNLWAEKLHLDLWVTLKFSQELRKKTYFGFPKHYFSFQI